jgi:hypothetical protein
MPLSTRATTQTGSGASGLMAESEGEHYSLTSSRGAPLAAEPAGTACPPVGERRRAGGYGAIEGGAA